MEPTQAQIVMETLDEIKAKIQDLTIQAQDQSQAKEQDHVEHHETSLPNVTTKADKDDLAEFEAWTRRKTDGSSMRALLFPARNDLEDKARNLIRKLQESNDEQGEKILNLQMLLAELQAQPCPRGINQISETPILSSQVSAEAENQNDSDSELHETPILTPLTPVSKETASRIRTLSDSSEPPSDFSAQAGKALDRISQLLAPTGTLTEGSITNALDPVAQDTLQSKIASLEETLHSKTRQITDMEHDHEETVRLITEQLDNVYSRINPVSSNSTDSRDAQMKVLDEANKELKKELEQNIKESASIQNVQGEYIIELEKEVKGLREAKSEVLRLNRKLIGLEESNMEMEDNLIAYREYIERRVPEGMVEENEELHRKLKSLKALMKALRDELKEALDMELSHQDRSRLEYLALREDLPAGQDYF